MILKACVGKEKKQTKMKQESFWYQEMLLKKNDLS